MIAKCFLIALKINRLITVKLLELSLDLFLKARKVYVKAKNKSRKNTLQKLKYKNLYISYGAKIALNNKVLDHLIWFNEANQKFVLTTQQYWYLENQIIDNEDVLKLEVLDVNLDSQYSWFLENVLLPFDRVKISCFFVKELNAYFVCLLRGSKAL